LLIVDYRLLICSCSESPDAIYESSIDNLKSPTDRESEAITARLFCSFLCTARRRILIVATIIVAALAVG
jgi:hypothetical protein